jgi:PPOX class probable F420-dependent enzyme
VSIAPDLRIFIESQRVARLATVDNRCAPHIVPVCFALIGDTAYTAIDEKPKREGATLLRLRNIERNARVQLLVDIYDDADWTGLRYVQLRGTARTIESGAERARAIQSLRERYHQYEGMDLESHPLIAIDVKRVVDWRGGPL